ncbi:hypothetical protein C8J56DRAFT_1001587 [Mycena floridula]|nr:hypothetical protein C8J56DRAFT_1001587 [Mycena floridula]
MHLVALNNTELLMKLWRGKMNHFPPDNPANWPWKVLTGKVWDAFGDMVAKATPYIPSSFDRAPQNPAEKINSGYKAWEWLLLMFRLAPALLRRILPLPYWLNFCKFVRGVQLLQQRRIPPENLRDGTQYLNSFVQEFEDLYCQRREDRIHFVHWCIHMLTHIGPETVRVGPLPCYSQWTMETAIGSLGSEIRQDRDPFANLTQRSLLHAQMNSLRDLGDGYVLLAATDDVARDVTEPEGTAIMDFWKDKGWSNLETWPHAVKRWARLHLPNGQILCSCWIEQRSKQQLRETTIAKICTDIDGKKTTQFGEVQYFFRLRFSDDDIHTLAVVSLLSPPNQQLLDQSLHTVYCCRYQGDTALKVFKVKDFVSVVSMVPDFHIGPDGKVVVPDTERFLVEKPYLDITTFRDEPEDNELNDGN